MSFTRYGVIIEGGGEGGYAAYVPDLLGCIGAGETINEVKEDMCSAISAHVNWLLEEGNPVPGPCDVVPVDVPHASVTFVEVDIPNSSRVNKA